MGKAMVGRGFCGLLVMVCALAAPAARGFAEAKAMTETEKIEALIRTVENLKDAVFIRNGTEYDGKAAAEHLRAKWNWQKADIKTARDFIRLAASKSSVSGESYHIRFKDGRTVTSEEFLLAELAKLEGKPAGEEKKGGG
jgi:hypothetical protein